VTSKVYYAYIQTLFFTITLVTEGATFMNMNQSRDRLFPTGVFRHAFSNVVIWFDVFGNKLMVEKKIFFVFNQAYHE